MYRMRTYGPGILSLILFVHLAFSHPQQPRPLPPDVQQKLAELGEMNEASRFREAEETGRKYLAEVEAKYGAESLEAAEVIDLLVRAAFHMGRAGRPENAALAQRAVSIKERLLGPEHLDLVPSIRNVAAGFVNTGQWPQALPLFERSISILEKHIEGPHVDKGRVIAEIAQCWNQLGDKIRALELYAQSIAILEETVGPDHRFTAVAVGNMGMIYRGRGEYEKARPMYERAARIYDQYDMGPNAINAWRNYGGLLGELGDFSGAMAVYERTLVIVEKTFGPNSTQLAGSLNRMANLHEQHGNTAEAIALHQRILTLTGYTEGQGTTSHAYTFEALARLHRTLGDFSAAREFQQKALAIYERTNGPQDLVTAFAVKNLAQLATHVKLYPEARALYERSLAVMEKALGPDHVEVALLEGDFAQCLAKAEQTEDAKVHARRALAILAPKLKSGEPYGPSKMETEPGYPIFRTSRYALPTWVVTRSSLIRRPRPLPSVMTSANLTGLAALLGSWGDRETAIQVALRAEPIGREAQRLYASAQSEREALLYAPARSTALDVALSVASTAPLDPGARRRLWDAVIRARALVLDEMAARHNAASQSQDPAITRLASELAAARERLVRITIRGPENESAERFDRILSDARKEKETAEQALSRASQAFRLRTGRDKLGLAEVVAHIPSGSALLAFVRFPQNPRPLFDDMSGTEEAREAYLALILAAGNDEPQVVPLGPSDEIDELVRRHREQIGQEASAPGRAGRRSETAYREAAMALRQKIWDPLAPQLGKAERVFIVPDGALHLVNFAALPTGRSEYLLETGPRIHYLSAERDLVPLPDQPAPGKGLLAVGAPAFAERNLFAALAPEGRRPARPAAGPTFRGLRSACPDFRTMQFESLPASAEEVRAVGELWRKNATTLRGAEAGIVELTAAAASEEAFKQQAAGKRALHLATHGFFVGGTCSSALEALQEGSGRVQPEVVKGENPLLLAGLALAGANHRQAAGPEEEDGILTAEEIAALDLSGVEWAVLSACDTGVGEVRAGEGVLGLRRAFQVAGARTLIMSLWPVEDRSARDWMLELYRGRLAERLSTIDAVHQASVKILRDRRAKRQSTHPFYWAGFVAAGDWR